MPCCGPPASLLTPAHPPRLLPCSELYYSDLSGTFPAQGWAQLPALQHLGVGSNRISGRLQGRMPDSLQSLTADGNQLTGVADGWRPPPGLRILNLENNDISGTLREAAAWLPPGSALEEVHLDRTQLRSTIPPDLQLPPRLRILG